MSTPVDESSLPIGELFARACLYRVAAKDTAGECVWLDGLDALLDRLLDERPDLKWTGDA
jgi:hypothetical protein